MVVKALAQRYSPNIAQLELGRAIFGRKQKFVFCRWGRKCGKTEGIIDTLTRFGMFYPGSACYYVGPLLKQSKEILWANRRLQNFMPKGWIRHEDRQELRLTLQNDSFIKVDGSDNFDAWAGITPDIVVLDEFATFKPQFYEVMNPNRAPKDAPLIIIGTPPRQLWIDKETPHQYCKLWNQAEQEQKTGEAAALHFPSWANDKVPGLIKWLEREKQRLEERGEGDVWRREYGAEFVESAAEHIFPQPACWSREMVKKHPEISARIHQTRRDWQFFIVADPSSSNCFAVLFIAWDPYKSRAVILDEIYEKRQAQMSTDSMWARMRAKAKDIGPLSDWHLVYDEAAAWFYNEMIARYFADVSELAAFSPSNKSLRSKDEGISLMKDIFRLRLLEVSDRAEGFKWEVENYVKNPKTGQPEKKHDHTLDAFRYFLNFAHFQLNEKQREQTGAKFPERPYVQPKSEESRIIHGMDADLTDLDTAFFPYDLLDI